VPLWRFSVKIASFLPHALPMLNRSVAPPIYPVQHLHLPKPVLLHLSNGIPLWVLDFPDQQVLRIDVVYRAGRPEETKKLAARATSRLLRDGSKHHSGGEIAEIFDYYGGTFSAPSGLDLSSFALSCLQKHSTSLIPLFAEVLQEPLFPEAELETFKRTNIQALQVELEKVEVLAYRHITEQIFGSAHPYGYNSVVEDYQALERSDLVRHYETWHTPSNCRIIACGRVQEETIRLLDVHFGQNTSKGAVPKWDAPPPPDLQPQKLHIPRPKSLQSAIKTGRRAFSRRHPDAEGLFVLNTILGGYFGSRLMTNIREKKGYTYNIYSTLDMMLHDGCFYIATEVSPEKTTAALRAIFAEMKKLREQPVPEEELTMVKNYLLGMLLNGLDGPLNTSDLVRSYIIEEIPWESFDSMVHTIRTISSEKLQALAQEYLRQEDFWVVTVGGK
jgi:zinc protease